MTRYERQCRWLLRAFPSSYRAERGEALVTTLLDDAPPTARWVSPATAFDLLSSGARIRARRAGATTLRQSAAGGLALAAVIGLALQAAVAIASVVFRFEHGIVFNLPAPFSPHALGARGPAAWVVLAVASTVAFAAAVRGAWRLAAVVSVAASGYLLAATAVVVASPRHGGDAVFSATPGFLALSALASVLAVVTAMRSRRHLAAPRSVCWLGAGAGLALLFSLAGDGNAAQGSSHLTMVYPPQGGILTALQVVFGAAVVIAVVWSRLDPRAGWAIAVLAIPFIAYQISDLTIASFYYNDVYQPWWETALPLILAITAVAALIASAILTTRRLRHP
jgi:hypothetical protein